MSDLNRLREQFNAIFEEAVADIEARTQGDPTMSNDIRHTPSGTHLYGLYDPEGDGITFHKSAEERDEAAKKTIQGYLQDGTWWEEVTGVFAFVVTHCATEIDVVRPVGEIDPEDACDEAGEYWPDTDCEYKCNYALKPFPETTDD